MGSLTWATWRRRGTARAAAWARRWLARLDRRLLAIHLDAAGGLSQVGSLRQARWETCKTCPMLSSRTMTCQKCGCFMPVKVDLAGAKCPMGKW